VSEISSFKNRQRNYEQIPYRNKDNEEREEVEVNRGENDSEQFVDPVHPFMSQRHSFLLQLFNIIVYSQRLLVYPVFNLKVRSRS
jgi:hypothetical protein